MPEGPFGVKRLTNLGPLASDDVEINFEEERERDPIIVPELKEEIQRNNWEYDWIEYVSRKVVIKQEVEETGVKVLDDFKKGIASLGERIALIEYYMMSNGIGYIKRTEVDTRFRREGVASEMRRDVLEDMRQRGMRIVYSYPSNNAGRELAESQGFSKAEGIPGFMEKEL